MTTRKELLLMLKEITREDQPVLGRIDGASWAQIILWPKHSCTGVGGRVTLAWVKMSLADSPFRFGMAWIKYNRWLHDWYEGKGSGPIAGNKNEHRTQLRAAGYSEVEVEKTMEELRLDRLRYAEFKKRKLNTKSGWEVM